MLEVLQGDLTELVTSEAIGRRHRKDMRRPQACKQVTSIAD